MVVDWCKVLEKEAKYGATANNNGKKCNKVVARALCVADISPFRFVQLNPVSGAAFRPPAYTVFAFAVSNAFTASTVFAAFVVAAVIAAATAFTRS